MASTKHPLSRNVVYTTKNMARVLVHCSSIAQTRSQRRSPRSFTTSSFTFLLISIASLLSAPSAVLGQAFLNNGQFFTKGLAISDAPAPGRYVFFQFRQSVSYSIYLSPQHAGSNIVIAADVRYSNPSYFNDLSLNSISFLVTAKFLKAPLYLALELLPVMIRWKYI